MKRNVLRSLAIVVSLTLGSSAIAQVDPIADANRRRAESEADKAASDASRASSEAATAATKAKFGPLADYTTEGKTEAGTDAGKMEAQILANEATKAIAILMVDRLKEGPLKLETAKKKVLIVTETERPSFEAYDAFTAQYGQIKHELERAQKAGPKPKPKAGTIKTTTSSIPMLINIAGNLLRSDYKIATVSWTPDEVLLARAIVFEAREKLTQKFYTPSASPTAMTDTNPAVIALTDLATEQAAAEDKLEEAKTSAGTDKKMDYSAVISGLETAIKHSEDFFSVLRTADKGVTPMVAIARQAQISEILKEGYLLTIKSHASGGSTYTKKNFWTFLGTMPFFVSGGALSSYSLTDGADGEVLETGVFGKMEPFMKIHGVSGRTGK